MQRSVMKKAGRPPADNHPPVNTLQIDTPLTLPPKRYCPHVPTPKQLAFLLCPRPEAFFGGAAGPGKTEGLLMSALQFVEQPRYQRTAAAANLSAAQPVEFHHESHAPVVGEDRRVVE